MEKLLSCKIDDMKSAALKGRDAVSCFLNPEEQYHTASCLRKDADNCIFAFYGGYPEAERKRLFLFPTYLDNSDYIESVKTASVAAVYIRGSGYVRLSHRSFMGAVLALGIRRGMIGDIVVKNERDAIVFCDEKIAVFLLTEKPLVYVDHDKIAVERYIITSDFDAGRKYERVADTIASARLDSVVTALTGLSRERAKTTVKNGDVNLNFTQIFDCHEYVKDNDIISVRGFGKYKIEDINTKTRKDRLRLFALKYI